MKISKEFPPNYDLIKAFFPRLEDHKPTFAFGGTIYNPFGVNITPDIEAHEVIHDIQQKGDPDNWWKYYLGDPEFRLEQEIEAYGTQYLFAKQSGVRGKMLEWLKNKLAMSLSGDLYGNMCKYQYAEDKIRNFKIKA